MIIENYRQFGGAHNETAALKNVLAQAGGLAPHTKQPYSEAMLLGLGGGLDAGYLLVESGRTARVVIGARHKWQSSRADFLRTICRRIGARVSVKETGGAKTAEAGLKDALRKGRPALTWGSLAGMPYYGLPQEQLKWQAHVFVVYGWDERNRMVCIDDRSAVPWHITTRDLAFARSAISSLKNRLMTVTAPKKPADLRQAISAGLQDCSAALISPASRDGGLAALKKWEELLTDTKSAKGWPRLFKPGLQLYRALLAIHDQIETAGTGGSAFRTLYADFLDEAATVADKTSSPIMQDAAAQYRRTARQWSALAEAALPDEVKLLGDTRDVMTARFQLFSARGPAAARQMQKIHSRLAALEAEATGSFPLRAKQVRELFGHLRQRVRKVHDAETRAAALLARLTA